MTPEKWSRVRAILEPALDLPPEQRRAYVDIACEGRPELKAQVESMLAAYERGKGFLESPAPEQIFERGADELPGSQVGHRVGVYRLVEELSRGGTSTVYLAERDDGQYRQHVALKLLASGAGGEHFVRRFKIERQVLAGLRHPNIAQLLDGGGTEAGLYLVMEYIKGRPIDEHCDTHRLSVHERLRLFLGVCDAVAHAHRNLVVHRDLKPSNVLVTGEGVPKLLDFGIAKLLDATTGDYTREVTVAGLRPMTPRYASPEQVKGEPVTTTSDVYSLGVLLYELLTGRVPYRLKSGLLHEILRAICEQEPEKPSRAIRRTEEVPDASGRGRTVLTPVSVSRTRSGNPQSLHRRLSGDIDNIVLTALRKDPRQRYASVGQLSEDIRRHLEGLPVLASGNTFWYLGGRFVRKNRVAVLAAGAVALTLVGGGGLYLARGESQRG